MPLARAGAEAPDSLTAWTDTYVALAVVGVRSVEVEKKIRMHLGRFREYFERTYGHERITAVTSRDVAGWRDQLAAAPPAGRGLAPATVNLHLAHLRGFFTWVAAHDPAALPHGNPTKGVRDLPLPALEPRALDPAQVRTLKNVTDRVERFRQLKGRRAVARARREGRPPAVHRHARPYRDRAIVFTALSTGLRRAELVGLDLAQLHPAEPDKLRTAKRARLVDVRGKGGTTRTLYLSADARAALADYLEHERPGDADPQSTALFLAAASIASRRPGGRLSPRSINYLFERLGAWHDGEHPDEQRKLGKLRPHDLRHTFGFALAQATGADEYELQRRLGHQSDRYIHRYTNPPEHIAAGYVEDL
ncbi:hypothetical protein TH66_00145 [Carbonactinospora thermoautotrophica]|uniref:Integrase n=1 Tax=Carbonactinospora thermoautotrophica TaxID=1469144 RepID=A0A132N772_9ACTN|nr:tyrosine-type recombinase/integrase [Carbonactinospora thermoautotrophica]KWX04636.1 hypothetical protein TR74_24250 [Carbonactinospora thermoautotrophica]KWX05964.1 hypothetical protein TH66_00145 [Carbonactinospora thermoautotrophica]